MDYDTIINDAVETSGTGIYANKEYAQANNRVLRSHSGDSSDEVDPRKLTSTPSISELRWYYRRTLGSVLVEKPVKDVFKNGFEFVDGDGSGGSPDEARSYIDKPVFKNGRGDGNFIDALKSVQIKARRDGFALLFFVLEDNASGPHVSPFDENVDVTDVQKIKVWPVDRLTDSASGKAHDQIQDAYGIDQGDYEVRPTGIVVDARVMSNTYREPLGYIVDAAPSQFVHADRVKHYTWNTEVDHNYESGDNIERYGPHVDTLGEWEGDSVLLASYNLIKGLTKGNWAVMQALFRNAAHMYSVKVPSNAPDQEWEATNYATQNINSKSSMVFPDTDYEMQQFESGNEMDPSSHYDAIFNQICAVHEMTRSVLFGTQSGTVSGSEVDIQNYFNKIERFRSGRFKEEIRDYLSYVKSLMDGRTDESFAYDGVDIEWGPMFKVDSETRISMLQTAAQSMTTLIGQYGMTPDEARSFLSSEFVHLDLDDLTEEQMDVLDRIRLASSGQGPQALASEGEYTNAPTSVPTEAGRPEGAQQSSNASGATPNADESTVDELERIVSLYENDMLTDDEFATMKDHALGEDT